ncbi:valine--tRNA ligase [Patescibacteria group bacterium]|nr:valine--tRNA ligase [Patescibacteria group bacterium]MBU1721696.1 valine--tRNA ligase [Patescibacteria group bacterium]MBU1901449.1 valine--tRNA ligase [Patescibacteria group bacterium]
MKELPKAYEPQKYEDKIYKSWEESGFFNPDVCVREGVTDADAESFSMVLPPPNVTGTLHMGHAAMLAIEDTMTRYQRMLGKKTLWLPGTDHAAVATESKVEGLLIKNEGFTKPKEELGRDAFMEKVHAFARESHDTIVGQAKKMGSSLDWSREAFTLDEVRNKAVRQVFKKMYDDGLIYRGHRVINWSVKGQSTCSDDELVHVERPAKMYYFKYNKDFPITIATTRPETKLGDTAVAVHPEGKYKEYIGQVLEVENVGQKGHNLKIHIIGDDHVDETLGTGALGVTPAHSMVDFEMYQNQKALGNDIGLIQVIGEDGLMTARSGSEYEGLSVEEARSKFIEYLNSENLLEKEEEIVQSAGTSDRFKDVVEPLPKTQWFVDVNKKFTLEKSQIKGIESGAEVSLKELMQAAVRNGDIDILPERFVKTYFSWIDNLRDWCISRQIWYGHQIPAYIDIRNKENEGVIFFEENKIVLTEEQIDETRKFDFGFLMLDNIKNFVHSAKFSQINFWLEKKWITIEDVQEAFQSVHFFTCKKVDVFDNDKDVTKYHFQDPDTLDTWFSSGMWTFSTLLDGDMKDGESLEEWLARSQDFQDFHPTQMLETGYDIIFFWVARMILMTTYTLGTVPFDTVYFHGLVRDEKGRKMSKSLGNILNPLDMIGKYGADATRLSLMIGTSPGQDMKLSEEKVEGLRNFANKLWNISRFMLMNIDKVNKDIEIPEAKTLADKWILDELLSDIKEYHSYMNSYNFSQVSEMLRDYTWNKLADWYLEIAKVEGNKSEILNYILNTILKLWHPFMPFVTESIWKEIYGENEFLLVERVPSYNEDNQLWVENSKEEVAPNFKKLQGVINSLITKIRNLRAEKGIAPSKKLKAYYKENKVLEENTHIVNALARLESFEKTESFDEEHISFIEAGVECAIDFSGVVDKEAEKERIEKEIAHIKPYLMAQEKKLSNAGFVDNAPEAVVNAEKEKLREAKEKLEILEGQLQKL